MASARHWGLHSQERPAPQTTGQLSAVKSWRHLAACKGLDTSLFYPVRGQHPSPEALSICGHCPVSTQCLNYAVATVEQYGIWGQTTPEQRRRDHWGWPSKQPDYVTVARTHPTGRTNRPA